MLSFGIVLDEPIKGFAEFHFGKGMASLERFEPNAGEAAVQKTFAHLTVVLRCGDFIVRSAAEENGSLLVTDCGFIKLRGFAGEILIHRTHENPNEVIAPIGKDRTDDAGPLTPSGNASCRNRPAAGFWPGLVNVFEQ